MIKEKLEKLWDAINELEQETFDQQPSDAKKVTLNLIAYLRQDTKYIAHKQGVKLQ